MRISLKGKNPFAFLFVSRPGEHYLAEYVLREYARGRSLEDVLADPYVRNRSTPEEQARLLERPELVAAIGEQAVADLRLALSAAGAGEDRRDGVRTPLAPPARAGTLGTESSEGD